MNAHRNRNKRQGRIGKPVPKRAPRIPGIISARVYTFNEIANELGIHVRTVQMWHKRGLKTADNNSRPYLVKGSDLIRYIDKRKKSRRCRLRDNEMYCLACKSARVPSPATVSIVDTGYILGNGYPQYRRRGACSVCGNKINRLVTQTQLIKENENEPTEK